MTTTQSTVKEVILDVEEDFELDHDVVVELSEKFAVIEKSNFDNSA